VNFSASCKPIANQVQTKCKLIATECYLEGKPSANFFWLPAHQLQTKCKLFATLCKPTGELSANFFCFLHTNCKPSVNFISFAGRRPQRGIRSSSHGTVRQLSRPGAGVDVDSVEAAKPPRGGEARGM
jgi:hypothetical protein